MSILVIGAGVLGLNIAYKLRETGYTVLLCSESKPEESTSNGAGGLWMPFHCEPAELVDKWAEQTLKRYVDEHASGDPFIERISCMSTCDPNEKDSTPPTWHNCLNGLLKFEKITLSSMNISVPGIKEAFRWQGYVVDCPKYLDRLYKRLKSDAGVKMEVGERRFSDISEAVALAKSNGCIAIVNCAGSGSRELCNDENVVRARGALLHYERPKSATFVITNELPPLSSEEYPTYLIPRGDILVVGGTYLEGDPTAIVPTEEAENLRENASNVLPELAQVEPKSSWVGFRPARKNGVRFETSEIEGIPVFHNYGHGGSVGRHISTSYIEAYFCQGWTIAEGAAGETVNAIVSYFSNSSSSRSKY